MGKITGKQLYRMVQAEAFDQNAESIAAKNLQRMRLKHRNQQR